MEVKTIDLPQGFEIDVKRFYMNGIIDMPCPCGGKLIRDFDEQYLSHPIIGEDMNISMHCDSCEKEYTIEGRIENIKIDISFDKNSIKEDI